MTSTVKQGNYYKNKTRDYYRDLGYTVELTEYTSARPIGGGRVIYQKKDILASDGIAYNDKEFILWNSKSSSAGNVSNLKSQGKKEYEKIIVPKFIKKQLVIWEPRQDPIIINV